ncbi:Crp/Fnr family transcriptional regulator [Micromonospora lutea]|uniref:Crp/Fnr family transcriptional regulator n=1 Tax=Micromonospora lutea TaxID=419825 RepID=A0ABQ4IPV7_9ACTN|nr:Crp/Fnr family transcriptional regulator [Micromonospora lutea]GIJ19946.1 Crp/Fnr family transcriptional regulator [Micromonospora lutea]
MTRPFLDLVASDEVKGLLALGVERRYPSRATLFHQGEPTQHVALLLSGWTKVFAESRRGDEVLLAIRGPDDILGELSAIDDRPRSATVTALVPVRARIIPEQRFLQHLQDFPRVMFAMLQHVTTRLRESDAERLRYVSTSSSGRVAALLLDLAERQGRRTPDGVVIDLPLTQQELAKAAATSREVVARTLRVLRDRGLVRTSRQRIVLVQVAVLRSLVDSVSDDA